MNFALFEDDGYEQLLPLTWLRLACELRVGRDTLLEKLRAHVGERIARLCVRPELRGVLAERLTLQPADPDENWCFLNTRLLVTADLLPPPAGVVWRRQGAVVAATVTASEAAALADETFRDPAQLDAWADTLREEPPPDAAVLLAYPWHLIECNADELHRQCRDGGVIAGKVETGAHLLNAGNIHVAAGARVMPGVVLNAEDGPIYVDAQAVIQPNAVVEGPCYVGRKSIVRPLASIRGGTSIGPVCKVGGEIEGTIFQAYSNKQHDGFLGHSFVAEWVNLGADTVTSDLKNTYGTIRASLNGVGVETGQHFLGSIIGDHTKTGICTVLPTGCILGVASNLFTQRPVPRFVPSFGWLTDAGLTDYRIEKAINIARTVMARRDVHLSDCMVQLLRDINQQARLLEAAGWA